MLPREVCGGLVFEVGPFPCPPYPSTAAMVVPIDAAATGAHADPPPPPLGRGSNFARCLMSTWLQGKILWYSQIDLWPPFSPDLNPLDFPTGAYWRQGFSRLLPRKFDRAMCFHRQRMGGHMGATGAANSRSSPLAAHTLNRTAAHITNISTVIIRIRAIKASI
jgi:hypothetical protein